MASYTVKKGESYASIAGDVYGNQRWMQALASANGGRPLTPGMVINIPNFDTQQSPVVTETFMETAAANQNIYDAFNQNVAYPNNPYALVPEVAPGAPVPEIVPQGQTVGEQFSAGYNPNINAPAIVPQGQTVGESFSAGYDPFRNMDLGGTGAGAYGPSERAQRIAAREARFEPTIAAKNVQQVKNTQIQSALAQQAAMERNRAMAARGLNRNAGMLNTRGLNLGTGTVAETENKKGFLNTLMTDVIPDLATIGASNIATLFSFVTHPANVAYNIQEFERTHGRPPTLDEKIQILVDTIKQEKENVHTGNIAYHQAAEQALTAAYNMIVGTTPAGTNRTSLPTNEAGTDVKNYDPAFMAVAILGETYDQRYGRDSEERSAQALSDTFLAFMGYTEGNIYQNQGLGAPSAGIPPVNIGYLAPQNILMTFASPDTPRAQGAETNPAMERVRDSTIEKIKDKLLEQGAQAAYTNLITQGVSEPMANLAVQGYSPEQLLAALGQDAVNLFAKMENGTTEDFFDWMGYAPRDDNPNIWHFVGMPAGGGTGTGAGAGPSGSLLGGEAGGGQYTYPSINISRYLTGGMGGGKGGAPRSLASNYGAGAGGLYLWRIGA